MVQKRFYNIQEVATIFGKSVSAVQAHIARKQFDAIPQPMRLGHRLAWLVESVEAWIDAKAAQANTQVTEYHEFMQAPVRRRGRPTKAEVKARKQTTPALSE